MLTFFVQYPYVVYSIVTWGIIAIFMRHRLRELWPIAIAGALILFAATKWLIAMQLFKIDITFLPIFGIPFFYILWGAGAGVIFTNFLKDKLLWNVVVILFFSAIVVVMEMAVEYYKRVQHIGSFNNTAEYIYNIFILTALAFIYINLPQQQKEDIDTY